MERCRWVRDAKMKFGGFWVPGCYARAFDGRDENLNNRDCDCFNVDGTEPYFATQEARIEKLEREVLSLRAQVRILSPPPKETDND